MDQVSLNMVLQKEIAVQEKEVKQMLQLHQEEKDQFEEEIREIEIELVQQQQAAKKMDSLDIEDFINNGHLKKYLKKNYQN